MPQLIWFLSEGGISRSHPGRLHVYCDGCDGWIRFGAPDVLGGGQLVGGARPVGGGARPGVRGLQFPS